MTKCYFLLKVLWIYFQTLLIQSVIQIIISSFIIYTILIQNFCFIFFRYPTIGLIFVYTTYRILTLVSYIEIYVYRYPLNDLTHSSTHRQEFYMVLTQPRFYYRLRRKGLFVANTIDDCPQQIKNVTSTTRSHNKFTAVLLCCKVYYICYKTFTQFFIYFLKLLLCYPGRN